MSLYGDGDGPKYEKRKEKSRAAFFVAQYNRRRACKFVRFSHLLKNINIKISTAL